MANAVETPSWLAAPSERRLREISHVTPLNHPYAKEYAASILRDALALRRLAVEFLRCANVHTSRILRLPPELLFEIFVDVVQLEPTNTKTLGWIRMGHVSHAFRSVLLSMRGLWASAVWDVAQHARHEVLARARDMPLSIHLKTGRRIAIDADTIAFAMKNIHDARHVEIAERTRTTVLWTYEPQDLAGRHFPHLEEIDVQLLHHENSLKDPDWLETGVYGLPPIRAPRLRSLRLVNVFVPFSPDNLTSISIVRTKYRNNGSIAISEELLPSPEQFLDMLARCVRVQTLWLQNVVPAIAPLDPSLQSSQAIELSSLRSLTLYAPMSEVVAFWSHLAPLPRETSILLKPDYTEFADATGGFVDATRLSLFSLFLNHLARDDTSRITALSFEADSESFVTQCGFFKRATNVVTSNWEGLPIYLEQSGDMGKMYTIFLDVWFSQCTWDDRISLTRFIDHIPGPFLSQIEMLDVMVFVDEGTRRLFSRLPNLHTLHLRSPKSSSLAALVYRPTAPDSTFTVSQGEIYLRKLTHLHLYGLGLCDDQTFNEGIPHFEEMLDVLLSRRDAGIPLLSLHITDFRYYGDWSDWSVLIVRIREIVSDVVVNM